MLSWTGLNGEDQVEQNPQTLKIQENESLDLNCSFTVSNFRGLFWYRQDPGRGPELLFSLFSESDNKHKGRLIGTLLKKRSSLHIKDSKPEDSATYLCAVVTQWYLCTCSLYPNPAAGALEEWQIMLLFVSQTISPSSHKEDKGLWFLMGQDHCLFLLSYPEVSLCVFILLSLLSNFPEFYSHRFRRNSCMRPSFLVWGHERQASPRYPILAFGLFLRSCWLRRNIYYYFNYLEKWKLREIVKI